MTCHVLRFYLYQQSAMSGIVGLLTACRVLLLSDVLDTDSHQRVVVGVA